MIRKGRHSLLLASLLYSVSAMAGLPAFCVKLVQVLEQRAQVRSLAKLRGATSLPHSTKFFIDGKTLTLETIMQRYAQLLLKTGINLEPGDSIVLFGNPEHFYHPQEKSFAGFVEEEAYRMGAKFIVRNPNYAESGVLRTQYATEHSPTDYLPASASGPFNLFTDSGERWSVLAITPTTNRYENVDLDLKKQAEMGRARSRMQQGFSHMQGTNQMPWLIAMAPTLEYAQSLFPGTKMSPLEKLYRAWEVQIKILGLQHDDPVAHWAKLNADAVKIAAKLNELKVRTLHFQSKDLSTDLRVEIIPECGWVSCIAETPVDGPFQGRSFSPNLPSFEVFTTPHRQRISGRMQATRPVLIQGKTIEGLWLKFENGEVIDYGATRNAEVLKVLFEQEPSFRFAGEIALVDISSPVYQSGMIFGQVLYDENAAIHLALGSGYPLGLSHLSESEYEAQGVNLSDLHHDLMFGSDQISVTGIRADGSEVDLMKDGRFDSALTAPAESQP